MFDEEALIKEYHAASIFAYPSLAETGEAFGLAALEAMAAGCAVIVSNLRCFDDFIADGITSLRFDHRAGDPQQNLAAALARLMNDRALLERIAEGGHAAACRFRSPEIAARMLADFTSLVAKPC